MDRILNVLVLALIVSFNASANEKNLFNRGYRRVTEQEALLSLGSAKRTELNHLSIKALVWNIKKAALPNWESEFKSYSKDQDLILIQEALQTKRFIKVTDALNDYRWHMGVSFVYIKGERATGTMVGSVVDPSYVRVRLSQDLEPVAQTPKTMTIAKYPIQHEKEHLLVINVHAINITNLQTFIRQMKQAEDEIAAHTGPIFFAGDFNTRTVERTRILMDLAETYKLKTVEFKNGQHRMRWKFTNNYLDHAFVRGLSIKSAEVLKNSTGSDHRPMVLDMKLE